MEFKRLAEEGWKALLHALFEHAPEALFVLDSAGRIVHLNCRASDGLGCSREELIGRCPAEFDAGWTQAFPPGTDVSRVCSPVSFQTTHRRTDGTVFPVHALVVPLGQEGHGLALFYARDLSERESAQEALRRLTESERRLEAAQRIAAVGWWELDFLTGLPSMSDECFRIFGVPADDLPNWPDRWFSLLHPEDRARTAEAAAAALAGGPRYDVEYRFIRPDGTVRVARSQGDVTWDTWGRPLRQFGVTQDITELRQAEEAIRETERRDMAELKRVEAELRARQELLDLAQRAAHAVAFDWCIGERESENRWSPELEAMYGLEPGTFDGSYEGWRKLLHPDDWPAVQAAIEHAQESGDVAAEFRVVHKDRTVHWLRAKGRMFFDGRGQPERMVGFMFDVTDWREAQEALRASEVRFRTVFDRATDAFFLLDDQLAVIDVNQQACASLGYSREELVGMHPRQFDASMDDHAIGLVTARAAAGETITFETLHRRRDDTVFPVEIRTGTFRRGDQLLYIALARDVSERKAAEQTMRAKDQALQAARTELARVARVTTMGELTASIAHEVNQPLAAMVANAAAAMRWLAADPPEAEKAGRALQGIAADGRRAREVIQRIRALAQRRPAHMTQISVNDTIGEVLALAQQELRLNGVVLARQLSPDLPPVLGDRIQLQQVLLNLVVNAIEAMSGVNDRPRELTITSGLDGSEWVLIQVCDTGPGFEREQADRLFEAFHTTKPEGLGIGLSISRSIIEAHGGQLSAAPNVPNGAIFRFTLPVQEGVSA